MTQRRQIAFTLNGRPVRSTRRDARNDHRGAAARLRPVRRARELRPGPVRMLHGAGQRHSGFRLPLSRRVRGRATVATVEGLSTNGDACIRFSRRFIAKSGFQCGFCTPGFILMTKQLLERHPHPTDEEIRHFLSGNLCRCAAYPDIVEAVKLAAQMMSPRSKGPALAGPEPLKAAPTIDEILYRYGFGCLHRRQAGRSRAAGRRQARQVWSRQRSSR